MTTTSKTSLEEKSRFIWAVTFVEHLVEEWDKFHGTPCTRRGKLYLHTMSEFEWDIKGTELCSCQWNVEILTCTELYLCDTLNTILLKKYTCMLQCHQIHEFWILGFIPRETAWRSEQESWRLSEEFTRQYHRQNDKHTHTRSDFLSS